MSSEVPSPNLNRSSGDDWEITRNSPEHGTWRAPMPRTLGGSGSRTCELCQSRASSRNVTSGGMRQKSRFLSCGVSHGPPTRLHSILIISGLALIWVSFHLAIAGGHLRSPSNDSDNARTAIRPPDRYQVPTTFPSRCPTSS